MSSAKPIIAVAYYSTYGHIGALADEVIEGVKAAGAEVRPYFIQETLPKEVLDKMYAGSSLSPKYPILTPDALKEVDGLILGAPTRYGRLPAQVSAFFDQCGGLWASKALTGKFAAVFTSTATPQGGQETTALTTIPFFAHLCYVPLGYSHPYIGDYSKDDIHGGSPWGASMMAGGQGERQPKAGELELAKHQGKFFAEFVGTYVRGKHALARAQNQHTATGAGAGAGGVALGAPVESHKAVPASIGREEGKDGFVVPAKTENAPAHVATPAAEPASAAAAPVPAAAAPPKPAPSATTAPAQAHNPAQHKGKAKGGFFSCCGAKSID